VAIPLLQDDCADTNVDLEWVWDYVHLTSADKTYRMDLDALREQVATWFSDAELERLMGPATNETDRIARARLARDGKRWRPFLTACAWRAMQNDPADAEIPDTVRRAAIAVECFHKASLIHDDIEDEDLTRYDQPTVHAEHGVAVAINAGDLLLGEGYRMVAEAATGTAHAAAMLAVASAGHRDLCLGQGDELTWQNHPTPLKSTQVLEIFRRKTAPAFEVALRLGATLGGVDEQTHAVLSEYSENLGIAYQIRDDLEDWAGGEGTPDAEAMRPTLLPALAFERAKGENRALLNDLWCRKLSGAEPLQRVRNVMTDLGVHERAQELGTIYKEQAIKSFQRVCKAFPKSGQASRAHAHLQTKYKITITLGGAKDE